MSTFCREVRQQLILAAGHEEELSADVQEHLARCSGCRRVAMREARFSEALVEALPSEDPSLQSAVLELLPQRRWPVLRVLPLLGGLCVALFGASLWGGVPGGSVGKLLPGLVLQGLAGLAGAIGDKIGAAFVTVRALTHAVPAQLSVPAALAMLLGIAGLVLAAGSYRRELG